MAPRILIFYVALAIAVVAIGVWLYAVVFGKAAWMGLAAIIVFAIGICVACAELRGASHASAQADAGRIGAAPQARCTTEGAHPSRAETRRG